MKSTRIYLLLVILSALVIFSSADEEASQTNDSTVPSEGKRRPNAPERHEQRQRQKNRKNEHVSDEPENAEDFPGFLSSYADNRYTASNGVGGNYRTRPRAQQQHPVFQTVDSGEGENWSGVEFPNAIQLNLPPMGLGHPHMADNAPTCYSLVDSQYPIFSDVCGAVPQARYALPNALGLNERWQIAQFLTNVVGASTESGCTRSLRLLVCPILFPPCQSRQETPPPVLPCQSYCRAVKSRCAIPTLDALACETLPYVSDICPTNQAYGSFIPPTAAQPSFNPQSPSNYQASRALASLHALLAAQAAQSQMNQASFSSPDAQQQYNPALLAAQTAQSQMNQAAFPSPDAQSQYNPTYLASQNRQQLPAPTQQQQNPLFLSTKTAQVQGSPSPVNARHPYSADTLSNMFAELSSQAQGQRYASPLARGSPTDGRYASLAYPRVASPAGTGVPSGVSTLVRA